jgi:N,N'-diacetyllegionaminate synthase
MELKRYCDWKDILFLSTPFDRESVDFLAPLVPLYKVGSGEITNLPFLEHVAKQGVPVILSTGMASLGEVEQAVGVFLAAENSNLALLHCVSNYPANPADCNLRAMRTLEVAFGLPVGFSDHTLGLEVALGAVALGASIIEKHFTLDRTLPGPDHQSSSEPAELKALVRGIRTMESALGDGRKSRAANEEDTAQVARKSIVATGNIPAGQTLQRDMLALRRPGTGLPSTMLPYVLGRTARQSLPAGTLITFDMLT